MMTEGASFVESALTERSVWADFARLALVISGACAVRLEIGREAVSAGRSETEGPHVLAFTGGLLLLFGGAESDDLDALVRRIADHAAALRREADRSATLALADRANGIARSAALRFETLFEGLPVSCYACDIEGRLMEWNLAAEEAWPALAAAWGEEAAPLVAPSDPEGERRMLARVLAGESVRAEERETGSGSDRRWHLAYAFPLRDPDGSVVGAIITRLDITRRREAQREVADREARLRTVLETLEEGLIVLDEAGRVVLRNQSAERILRLGSGPMELTAAYPDGTVVDSEGRSLPRESRPIIVALRTGQSARNIRLGLTRPGEMDRIWVRVNAEPLLRPDDGTLMGAVATFREVR